MPGTTATPDINRARPPYTFAAFSSSWNGLKTRFGVVIDAILIRNPSDSEFYYHHIWVSAREVEALLNWFSLLEKVGSRQALSTLSLSPFTLDSPFPSLVRASCQPLVRQLLMGTCTALQDKHIACNKHPQYLLGFLSVGLRRRLSGLLEYWAGSLALFYDYARTHPRLQNWLSQSAHTHT